MDFHEIAWLQFVYTMKCKRNCFAMEAWKEVVVF